MWPFGTINKYPYTDCHELNTDWILAKIQSLDGAVSSFIKNWSSPKAVSSYQDFTDQKLIYLYTGDEVGYNKCHWYYYDSDAGAWTDGGVYGAAAVDDALSLTSENAVQNKVITGAIDDLQENQPFISMVSTGERLSKSGISGSATLTPQGFVYNGSTWVFAFSNDSAGTVTLVERANNVTIRSVTISCGHGNDIDYVNDYYYLTDNTDNGKLIILNNQLVVINTIHLTGINYYLKNIAHDSNGDLYVIDAHNHLYKVDHNTLTAENINIDLDKYITVYPYPNIGNALTQGCTVFKDKLILSVWYGSSVNAVAKTRLICIDLKTFKVFVSDFRNENYYDEFEGITVQDDKLVGYSYYDDYLNLYSGQYNAYLNNTENLINLAHIIYSGNDDVFDVVGNKIVSLWYVSFSTAHPKLGENPGILISYNTDSTYGKQIFINVHGIYERRKANRIFNDWFKSTGLTSTHLTFNDKTFTFDRIGQMVFVNAPQDMPALAAGEHVVGQLPDGFKPFYNPVRIPVSNDTSLKFMTISSGGEVKIYNPSTTTSPSNYSISGSYVAFG